MTYKYVAPNILRVVQICLLGTAVAQGIDLQLTINFLAHSNGMWNSFIPGWMMVLLLSPGPSWSWSILFISSGVAGLLGEAWMQRGRSANRGTLSWTAHSLLSVLYAVLGTMSLVSAITMGLNFSTALNLLLLALLHYMFRGRRRIVSRRL